MFHSESSEILREILVAFHETEGVGEITISRLVNAGALEDARSLRQGDWRELGCSAKQADAIVANLSDARMEASVRRRERSGISIVTKHDDVYPPLLKEITDPPWVLYYIGRLDLSSSPAAAIVGTRLATAYGRRVAEDLASACSYGGLTVVSGLAKGIDAAAHAGALQGPGSTVAVLASPVDFPYPPENRALYRSIAAGGLLLSETPPGIPLHPGMFPRRNRIIAGLSSVVVVVEAGESSGALITADLALKSNRDVFAVPGPITSPRSRGPLLLLRQGAKPVIDAADILEEYKDTISVDPHALRARSGLTPDESRVYRLLQDGPLSLDELADACGLTFGLLHSVLLSLQIKHSEKPKPRST